MNNANAQQVADALNALVKDVQTDNTKMASVKADWVKAVTDHSELSAEARTAVAGVPLARASTFQKVLNEAIAEGNDLRFEAETPTGPISLVSVGPVPIAKCHFDPNFRCVRR